MDTKNLARRVGLNFLTGAGFWVSVLVFNLILTATIGIQINDQVRELGQGFSAVLAEPFILVGALISLAVSGALVYFWVFARRWIAKPLKITLKPAQKVQTKHKIGLFLTFVMVGSLTWITFYGLNEFLGGLSPNADLANPETLLTGDPVLIVGTVIGVTILGIVVSILGRAFVPTQKFADTLTRDH